MEHTASFSIDNWSEDAITSLPEPHKFNRGEVIRTHEGYVCGKETMNYILLYANDGRSEFVGIGIFDGKIGEMEGRFALIERGSYQDKSVDVAFDARRIEPNGEFGSIIGRGAYRTGEHKDIPYIFQSEL